jgi:hypothetical protein
MEEDKKKIYEERKEKMEKIYKGRLEEGV